MVPNKANLIEHLFPQRHRDSEWGCQEQMLLTKLPNGTYLVSNEKGGPGSHGVENSISIH